MSIPNEYIIEDYRQQKDFDKKTFSGFSIKEVYTTLKQCILNNDIEAACHWTIELILSLQTSKLYELFLLISIKNINICNPNLPTKLLNRYKVYYNNKLSNIDSRNSQVIRNHLIELCVIITNSKKIKPINITKINNNEFNINNIMTKLIAPNNYIDKYLLKDDPEEIKIILNEFIHNIHNKNYDGMMYWISWLIFYEKKLNKAKQTILCNKRHNPEINTEFQTDIIWLIWDIVISEAHSCLNTQINTQIGYLFKLYKIVYKNTSKYKYIYIIFYALKYFSNVFNINQEICHERFLYIQACIKVNNIFKEKKHFERHKTNIDFSSQLNIARNKLYTTDITNKSRSEIKKIKLNRSLDQFDILSNIPVNYTNNNINNNTLDIMKEIQKKI
jgi:hypothetical protein